MSQDTNVNNLIINKLTKQQFDDITAPDPTQLYFVTDDNGIESLDDVSISNLSNGQILKYNSTTQKWENAEGGSAAVWGNITGTLSDQIDLSNALSGKQATLVSGTNIKTINNSSLLGGGNINVGTVTSVNNVSPVNGNVTLSIPTVDQTFDSTSENAQSGAAIFNAGFIKNDGAQVDGYEGGFISIYGYANSSGYSAIAIGKSSSASEGVAIGRNAITTGGIALGHGASALSEMFNVGFSDSDTRVNYDLLDGTTGLIPDARLSSNIARTSAIPTVDQTYSASSTNAQSGVAVASAISGKADSATTLSGYGITDAYTKTQVDGMISSVYKPAGSVAFASLPTLSASVLGNVYDVTDAFTTTSDFVEGAGKSYPANTNVVVVDVGTSSSPSYKFDVLSGFVDLSGYQPLLVSGTNIKTVNNNSLLGNGNITIDSLPSQTGNSGKFLTTDGTDASWATVGALPSQTGNSGKLLTTDGSAASWTGIKTINSTSLLGTGNINTLQNTATGTNALTIIGNTTNKNGAINIGASSSVTGNYSCAIGYQAEASDTNTLAIGQSAKATASDAIQIGWGTNSTADSLSIGFSIVGNYQLLDGTTGLIPDARLSTNIARTSDIPSISNLADKDLSNITATAIETLLSTIYPVGAVYISTTATCPLASLMPNATWTKKAEDRVLQGSSSTHAEGTTIAAGLPEIYGNATFTVANSVPQYAFLNEQSVGGVCFPDSSGFTMTMAASRSSSIYGSSTTVQPPAYVVSVWERTA